MSLKRIKYFFSTEAGLQVRMTLWVSIAVLIVATIIMTVASLNLRERFASEVRTRLSDDINATTSILDQRLKRVEYITKTTAALVGEKVDDANGTQLTSWMHTLMEQIDCIDVASIILHIPDENVAAIYTAYNHETDGKRTIATLPTFRENLTGDKNWVDSFEKGQEVWTTHFAPKTFPHTRLQCFSAPIRDKEGRRVGIICTMVEEKWLVKMIKQYKTRQDIDLSIYSDSGKCIVAPDDHILKMAPEDLIQEERTAERFGWRIIFSADRHIISDRLLPVMKQMVVTVLLLLVCIAIAIMLAVKYVARPFALKQEQDAMARASMERELQIAAETQHKLVPHRFPAFPDRHELSLHACLHPALEVGGDLYDYFIQGDRLYFCLGDVSGKGAPASLFMAATHYLFRSVAAAMPISDAVQQMNVSLCTDNEDCTFVTFFFGCLDLKTGRLEYCNAGHNSPILIHDGKARYFAAAESTPLGVWEEAEFPSVRIQLDRCDSILLYTDGVTEAMSVHDEEFGEERTLRCVNDCCQDNPDIIIDTLLQQVRGHAADAPQSDDITMLCIRYTPPEPL